MNIKKLELEIKYPNLETEHGTFTPNYTFSDVVSIKNEDGEVVDYEYVDFVLIKSAEEVYREYLHQLKDPTPEPVSGIEELKAKNQMLESALLDLAETVGGI